MPLLCWYSVASVICEALSGGGGGYMFPCSSEINWFVPLFPQILFSLFPVHQYCLCSPQNLAFLPLFPWNKCRFPLFTKSLRMPHMNLTDRPDQWAQQSIIHIIWLQSNLIGQKLNLFSWFKVNLNKIGTPKWLGPVAQSVVSSGPNTFVEVDHEIYSIVISFFLWFKKRYCLLQAKACAQSTA